MKDTSDNDNFFSRRAVRASDLPEPSPEDTAQVEEMKKQLNLLYHRTRKLFASWEVTPLAVRLRADNNYAAELTPQGLRLLDDLLAHTTLDEDGFSSQHFANRLAADIRAILVHGTQSNWLLALRMARLGLLQHKDVE